MYLTIQGYGTFGYCLVPPGTALYRLVYRRVQGGMRENQKLRNMLVCTSTYLYILVRTDSYQSCKSMHWFILLRIFTNQYTLVHTSTDPYIPAHTSTSVYASTYQYRPVHTSSYRLELVCTSTYQKFLDSKKLQTGFKPAIFCILFVYFTTALQVHSKQILGICPGNCLCSYPFCRRPPRSDPASGYDVHSTDLDWNLTMAKPSTVTVTGFGMCNVPAETAARLRNSRTLAGRDLKVGRFECCSGHGSV